jgi:hypothetical protein
MNAKKGTLTWGQLYEAAWRVPMIQLARQHGISNVALAKRCQKMGVPVPQRGYWARKDRGKRLRWA